MSCSLLQNILADVDTELAVAEQLIDKVNKTERSDLANVLNKEVKKTLTSAKKNLQQAYKQGKDTLTPDELVVIEQDIIDISQAIEDISIDITHFDDTPPSPEALAYEKKNADLAKAQADLNAKTKSTDAISSRLINQRAKLEADLVRAEIDHEVAKERLDEAKKSADRRDAGIKANLKHMRKLTRDLKQAEKRYNDRFGKLLEKRKELNEQLKGMDIPPEKLRKIQEFQEKFDEIVRDQGYDKIDNIQDRKKKIDSDVLLNRLVADTMKVLDSEADMSLMDAVLGVYYINLLSGPSTQWINVISTGINIGYDTFFDIMLNIRDPQTAVDLFRGTMDGIMAGAASFKDVVKNHEAVSRNLNKYQIPTGVLKELTTPTEQLRAEKRKGELLAPAARKKVLEVTTGYFGKHMSMLLMAADAFMRKTREGQLTALAAARLRNRGYRDNDGDFMTEVARYVNDSKEVRKEARDQAEVDVDRYGFYDDDPAAKEQLVNQRMFQIIEDQLGENIAHDVQRLSARDIFTGEPHGNVGLVAHHVGRMAQMLDFTLPGTNIKLPFGTFMIPFVNVPANVANEMMNYTPIGVLRGLSSEEARIDGAGKKIYVSKRTVLDSPDANMTYQQRKEFAKAAFGMATMAGLGALVDAYVDDEDPYFAAYGDMSKLSPEKRQSLLDAGVKQWSFKVGDKYFVFKENILAAILAPIAIWQDAKRWDDDYDEQTWISLLGQSSTATLRALSDASFVKGVRTLMDSFTGFVQTGKGDIFKTVSDISKQTARGFIPGWVRSMTKLPGATAADMKESFTSYILGSIPIASGLFVRPDLNIFGDEITVGEDTTAVTAFWTNYMFGERLLDVMSKDPELRYLGKSNLTIAAYPKHNEISLTIPGADKVQKYLVTSIMKKREALYRDKSEIEKYAERLAFDKLTDDERYDLVKISGPKFRSAVAYVRDVHGDKPLKERQKLLDALIKEAKAEAKAELLSRYATIPYLPKTQTEIAFDQMDQKWKEDSERAQGLRM